MCLIAAGVLLITPIIANASQLGPRLVETEISRIAKSVGGDIGVAAWRLDEKGPRIIVNGDERFPLASTYKVAIAGKLLQRVDARELSLTQMVAVTEDRHVPSEVIADRFIHPGVSLSVQNLLELMLTQSDNTATDVLMELAGGPTAVTAWVRQQGIADFRVDRDTAGVLRDFFALPQGPFSEVLTKAMTADPSMAAKGSLPNPAFDDDPRDTSTPVAAAELLTRIFSGKALSADSTQILIETLQRCRTGGDRMRGRLPMGTKVADKTGTVGGSVNDLGVISLPDKAGDIVVVIFIRKSAAPFAERERVIADVARAIYDFHLFNPIS